MPSLPPTIRLASLTAASLLLATPAMAQERSDAAARVQSVVVTAPSVRVRSAPFVSSLSIDEFREGAVFSLASDDYQSQDWLGIVIDGRIAFVPRYAVAPRPLAPSRAAKAETSAVSLAGAPASVRAPSVAATVVPAAVPVAAAALVARPASPAAPTVAAAAPTFAAAAPAASAVTPAPAPAVAARVAPATTAVPAPASAPAPASQVKPIPAAPVKATERVATEAPMQTSKPAAEPQPERPTLAAKRAGVRLTLGVLGSVTPVETSGLTPTTHVSGLSFVGARYRRLGAYLAPEMGQGGGYRSRMLGGGVSLDLLDIRMLRLSALAGYTTYSETPTAVDSASAPVTKSVKGTSAGGLASIPLLGPVRLAYRGQYVTVRDAGVASSMVRHSVGLIVF